MVPSAVWHGDYRHQLTEQRMGEALILGGKRANVLSKRLGCYLVIHWVSPWLGSTKPNKRRTDTRLLQIYSSNAPLYLCGLQRTDGVPSIRRVQFPEPLQKLVPGCGGLSPLGPRLAAAPAMRGISVSTAPLSPSVYTGVSGPTVISRRSFHSCRSAGSGCLARPETSGLRRR
jgi:hypothetical protein